MYIYVCHMHSFYSVTLHTIFFILHYIPISHIFLYCTTIQFYTFFLHSLKYTTAHIFKYCIHCILHFFIYFCLSFLSSLPFFFPSSIFISSSSAFFFLSSFRSILHISSVPLLLHTKYE